MYRKIMSSLLALVLVLGLVGCNKTQINPPSEQALAPERTTVASLVPAVTQIIVDLGADVTFVAVDNNSQKEPSLPKDVTIMDMVNPDLETLMALKPDYLFISKLNLYDGEERFEPLKKVGTEIVLVDSASSIDAIQAQIVQIGEFLGAAETAEEMVKTMNSSINAIKEKASAVQSKKRIMFEISPMPNLYSFGSGVFLNEVIEIIGAENVFADQESWIPITEESAIIANPDVIFTNIMGAMDTKAPVEDILARKGWEQVTAIENKAVYFLDPDLSSQPNHRIVTIMEEMFQLTYPEYAGN